MKFRPNKIIRYFCIPAMIGVFVVLPLWMSFVIRSVVVPGDENSASAMCLVLGLFGCILIYVGFWEKCFSTLILTDEEIRWKCPLKKSRVIPVTQCVEIGAYIENEGNGIPKPQIYFSDHSDPKRNMGKNGVIKASKHLIKFYYDEELCSYLLQHYGAEKTEVLRAYRDSQRDNKCE